MQNANNGVAAHRNNQPLGLADLKTMLATNYMKQIENYFGDPKKAMKFLSSVVASVQKNPKLLECEPTSVINAFITMAQLELMPSEVSGEAYVLPYNDRNKGLIAQFQLGYQGLVTLFYRAGAKKIHSDIVRKNDKFSYVNGEITHEPDVFSADRGEARGAYVIIDLQQGGRVAKVMSAAEIMGIGKKFSKSYSSSFSPWNQSQDPELWMWKKTVLKQAAKLVPKNESIYKAIAEDNKDSEIEDHKDRFNGLELPVPARIAEKKAAQGQETPTAAPIEETQASDAPKEAEVTYEATNDAMPCEKCGNGMSNTDVDFCDNAGVPHTCAD